MNCREFEQVWNERLDAREAPSDEVVQAHDAHAASCPACRALGARYHALSQAILTLAPPPLPPADFAARVLAVATRAESLATWRFSLYRLAPVAAAAALVLAVAIGLRVGAPRPQWPGPSPVVVARVQSIDPKDLTEALAVASSATWDLAREASAPAARVGRQVLDSAELPQTSPLLAMPAGVSPASEVWQQVEDRVNAGVRPLEGSARHAFGFLLGVAPEDEERPPSRPAKGA